jgi:hypothetical protein
LPRWSQAASGPPFWKICLTRIALVSPWPSLETHPRRSGETDSPCDAV